MANANNDVNLQSFSTAREHQSCSNAGLFSLQVVPNSGHGWNLVDIFGDVGGAPMASIYPKIALDYENPGHKIGLNFTVQVTDKVN